MWVLFYFTMTKYTKINPSFFWKTCTSGSGILTLPCFTTHHSQYASAGTKLTVIVHKYITECQACVIQWLLLHLWLRLLHFTCTFRAVCQCKLKLKIITAIYFQESVLRLCSRCPCRAPSKPPWRRSAKDQTVLWWFYGNDKTSILCRRQLQLIRCYFLKGQPKNTIINWALDLELTSYTHSFQIFEQW